MIRGVIPQVDPFKAYMIYMGLKAHFNSDYDYIKYGGKTSATRKSYLNRKDKAFFGKASRKFKEEVEDFEFNQDFEIEDNMRSPGWLRYQKRIK